MHSNNLKSPVEKADILLEVLPYIRRFYGKTIVIKYGGHAMGDDSLKEMFAMNVVMMKYIGINPVIVHGGGPQIGVFLKKLGKDSKFVRGMRVTDEETMDIVEMVLTGKVNKEIVGLINSNGGRAVGLSGKDGNIIEAERYTLNTEKAKDTPTEIIDIGMVGRVKNINSGLVKSLIADGFIPVIAPTGAGDGGETYNINADIVAGEMAAAIGAEKLILLTDVEGILDKKGRLINSINNVEAEELIEDGTINGGMYPKLKCCIKALRNGVGKTHIIDGRLDHSVLLEIFTDSGIGTEVVKG
ncbi:MAG: acetylglutamate kinase [Thermodesulfobacteriota bacterium]|nr:acetylglutamate kinase [Thermodesulfobacteriota bacterium]